MAYSAQQLVNMGYGGYQGWGNTEANADFNATGGRGKETRAPQPSPTQVSPTQTPVYAGPVAPGMNEQYFRQTGISKPVTSSPTTSTAATTSPTGPRTAQDLISMGFGGYQGWGDREAVADYNATKGRGKESGGAPSSTAATNPTIVSSPQEAANQVVQSSIDAWSALNVESRKRFGEYTAKNPFNFDEVLKQKNLEAQEQLDPYYNETLGDYLLGTQRKVERSRQDTQDLLGELSAQSTAYSENAQFKLNEAVQRAREGSAEAGLFESGGRMRSEGLLARESEDQLSDFNRRQALRQLGLERGLQRTEQDIGLGSLAGQNVRDINSLNLGNIPGVGTETAMQIRNLQRERGTAEESLANQLTGKQGQKYVAGFLGTQPPEIQANQNFDYLKQIGVYS